MESSAVQVDQLARQFGDRTALDGVSFEVPPGQIVGLLGPNGSGKTTLFRILATLLPPSYGVARVFDRDVVAESSLVRRRIGVVFQHASLDKKLTVAENLHYQGRLYGLAAALLRERIAELLARLKIADRAGDLVETLSGGMARRVEIAKGLMHRPALLLLDEPSTGLDPSARRDLWDALLELRDADGMTLLFTTHLMDEAERAARLLIMDAGRAIADGSPAELKSQLGGDVIRIDTKEPEALQRDIVARFGGEARVAEGAVRIERAAGHEFVPQLVGAFPGRIAAVSVGTPTLEDVFIHRTGHGLYQEPRSA